MNKLYSSPLRVYLCLGLLALCGIYSGTRLPVSLFPNSSKPRVTVNFSYGPLTSQEFLTQFGTSIESRFRAISDGSVEIEKLEAVYDRSNAKYTLEFKWGTQAKPALREVESIVQTHSARMPDEIRDTYRIWTNGENSGFLAISFYSTTRSLDDLYKVLEPLLSPRLSKVVDATETELWNPTQKEIRVELIQDKMAPLGLLPRDVGRAVSQAMGGNSGGSITVGNQQISVQMPRLVQKLEDLSLILVQTPSGQTVHLGDIARISYGAQTGQNRSFKTSGQASLILFASPKPGGNIKKMAEDIIAIVHDVESAFPKDVQYNILVDPSAFIRGAVHNVFHEVAIGALLAVLILFLFIGSFRNTVTAAIEIPISMVLAFILMRFSGMNLNLISLGGLALSAGMNVDASVVVMENIFRHFENAPTARSFSDKLRIITGAVREVQFAVIASTIASVVVFLPLAFTSDLSYAILGDLAKTVVFSHGFSAFVALILVPTVRLQLMSSPRHEAAETHSPIEKWIQALETGYAKALGFFISRRKLQTGVYLGLAALLTVLCLFVMPRLPREILGKPDTDWMMLGANTSGNTVIRQMESQIEEVESTLLKKFGARIQYTFTQVSSPNGAWIMARLKNKKEMADVWKEMEATFTNTPFIKYWVAPWNPAELRIPNPPQLKIVIRGGSLTNQAAATEAISTLLLENQVFPRVSTEPDVHREETITLRPHGQLWNNSRLLGSTLNPSDLADLVRVASDGRRLGELSVDSNPTGIYMRYPEGTLSSPEDIASIPIGVGGKILPLKALASVSLEPVPPAVLRIDEKPLFAVYGRKNESDTGSSSAAIAKARELVEKWKKDNGFSAPSNDIPSIQFEDAEVEIHDALKQLGVAIALSIALIFLTLVIQFGSLINAFLVLVAIPLGFIGVLLSLFIFRSTLSLNAALGVILLNGIAVANSIILVDFLKRLVDGGTSPEKAAVEAGQKRLRPILITSLTTILGMLPVALGFGDGGKILQPLGIAVSGGLWFSMALTLFVVPALQVSYLHKQQRSRKGLIEAPEARRTGHSLQPLLSLILILGVSLLAQSSTAHAALISMDQAISQILERSPELAAEKARVEIARSRALPARLGMLPSLSFDAKQTWNNEWNSGTISKQVEGVAQMNLIHWGSDLAGWKAADADVEAEEFHLSAAELNQEDTALTGLLQFISKTHERAIHQKLVTMEKELLSIAQKRFKAGLLPQQEINQVQIDLENATSALVDIELGYNEAQATLESLLGHTDVSLEWSWKARIEKAASELTKSPLPDLSVRPDWQNAEARARAENERYTQSMRLLFPSVDTVFAFGHYESPGVVGAPSWTAAIQIKLPFFDQFRTYSNARAQSFVREASEASLVQVQRTAKADWSIAQNNFEKALQTARSREKILSISQQLYQDNLKRFQAGRISANDLAINQKRLLDSELFSIQGWKTAHLALLKLCHARGQSVLRCG